MKTLLFIPTFEPDKPIIDKLFSFLHDLKGFFDILFIVNYASKEYENEILFNAKWLRASYMRVFDIPDLKIHLPLLWETARKHCLSPQLGYSHFLMSTSDMTSSPDLLERMLAHQKDIVCGIHFQRKGVFPFTNVFCISRRDAFYPWCLWNEIPHEPFDPYTVEITETSNIDKPKRMSFGTTTGLTLISREALKQINFRWDYETGLGLDLPFAQDCFRLREQGMTVIADPTIPIIHWDRDTGEAYDRERYG